MSINLNDLAYPFDPTGKLGSNKISGELQIVTPLNFRDYHFIVPRWAPFFMEGLKISFKALDGSVRLLELGKDFYATHEFISASRACATPIYGSISFLDITLSGVVTMDYQTLGGIWTQDEAKIAQILADKLHNPRITAWDQVVDMPVTFPVIDHEWDLVDMVGMSEVNETLGRIEDTLRLATQAGLQDHLNDFNNPHQTTAAQVGLGLVRNLPTATTEEAVIGQSNEVYMTPNSTLSSIKANVGFAFTDHVQNANNPHATTAAQVGAYSYTEANNIYNTKLDKTGVAADTSRFDTKDPVAFKAWVLEGSAANSIRLGGMSAEQYRQYILEGINPGDLGGYSKSEVDQKLLQKLNTEGTAANSARFNGSTFSEAALLILQGTSGNSNLLQGYNIEQIKAYFLAGLSVEALGGYTVQTINQLLAGKLGTGGKAADSALLNGKDLTALRTDFLTGLTVDMLGGYTTLTTDNLLNAKLDKTGTAANTTLFSGRDYNQVRADFLAGLNIGDIGGYTPAQVDALLNTKLDKTGTAADSSLLQGNNIEQIKAYFLAGLRVDLIGGYTTATIDSLLAGKLSNGGTAANSNLFAGNTVEQIKNYTLTGLTADMFGTYTAATIDQLLLTKLGTGGTAANSNLFAGNTVEQIKSYTLTGLTANMFGTYTSATIDQLLLSKLDKTGKAADSNLFNGRDYNQVKTDFLTGLTVEMLGGLSSASINQLLSGKLDVNGKAVDAALLNGKDFASLKIDFLTGLTVENLGGYTTATINQLLGNKLDKTATAGNSTLFDGRTVAQLTTQILNGTAANSNLLQGNNIEQIKAYTLTGTASNSSLFAGMNLQQLTQIYDGKYSTPGDAVGQTAFPSYKSPGSPANVWTPLGNITIPSPPYANDEDLQWFVAGGDRLTDGGSPFYHVRCSVRSGNPAVTLTAMNMTTIDNGAQFGYTSDGATVTIWFRTPDNRSQITVTELSKGSGSVFKTTVVSDGEPGGMTYTVSNGGNFATKAELDTMLTSLTTAFNQLTAALAP